MSTSITPTRGRQFRTNGSALSPIAGTVSVARAITGECVTSRDEIDEQVQSLGIGGVTDFQTKNSADSGGFASVFVERIA